MRVATSGAKRAFALASLLSLTALLLAAGGSAAPTPDASDTEGLVEAQWTPFGLRAGSTTVVLQLAGEPVASVEGDSGRAFSEAEKQALVDQLEAQQDAIRDDIAQLGGTVVGDYQVAYNGLKVTADRSKLDALGQLPGVTAVRPLQLMTPDNVRGVPLIGTPAVWDGLAGLHGEGIKVAVLDTGIDYTHANFGGPGTTAAFDAADAADTLPADASMFGPAAPRVKGGIDLVGDDYDASADPGSPALIPHPDPNPLDCNGHGSHVSGSAGGSGVLATGATYTGPYNATTISGNSWTIGPGVAPKVDLYGVRVFGCAGSTDVTVDAIEWAVDNDMDVINMSLGSPFGSADDPSAVATRNAAKAGVVVVTSAGNSGPSQYITGSPGVSSGAISTAASDPTESFPGVTITAGSVSVPAINANLHEFLGPLTGPIKVIKDDPATPVNEAEGCSVAAFGGPLAAGTVAVVNRGTCARVAKAIFGQQAGAAAVVMANNADAFPPLEGKITSNPDDGTPFTVTIPFLGVKGPFTSATSDGAKLRAVADGTSATMTPTPLTNPAFKAFASFSSGGPRTGDSFLKPDITAPGVSIVSTFVGSGNGPATISGTSMASPHVAGVAALTRQAHPKWSVDDLKAAIVNTGDPAQVVGYRTSRGGTGLVQPAGSTKTQVVAKSMHKKFEVGVNFGYEELTSDFSKTQDIRVSNHGSTPATFNVAAANAAGSPHTVGLSSPSITVPAGESANVTVTLNVPVATVGNSAGFREVAGLVTFTPASAADNGGVALRVPYYLVPRALSDISTALSSPKSIQAGTGTATIGNSGAITGDADFYAWGLEDANDPGRAANDIRAVGVQSFPNPSAADPNRRLIVFAVNSYERWSNANVSEYDISVDVDGDNTVDYIVIGVDQGAVQTGSFNGIMGAFVFSARSGRASIAFLAAAPTDSSTALIPVRSSQLCLGDNPATPAVDPEPCLSVSNPRFAYAATGFDVTETASPDPVPGVARYNAWTSSISQGGFQTVAPGATATEPIAINATEWALTPALGLMVVSHDDRAGKEEAQLLRVKVK
ncbi:MAG: S8 family serine peptidase [Gaiellaceae bacterium]